MCVGVFVRGGRQGRKNLCLHIVKFGRLVFVTVKPLFG